MRKPDSQSCPWSRERTGGAPRPQTQERSAAPERLIDGNSDPKRAERSGLGTAAQALRIGVCDRLWTNLCPLLIDRYFLKSSSGLLSFISGSISNLAKLYDVFLLRRDGVRYLKLAWAVGGGGAIYLWAVRACLTRCTRMSPAWLKLLGYDYGFFRLH